MTRRSGCLVQCGNLSFSGREVGGAGVVPATCPAAKVTVDVIWLIFGKTCPILRRKEIVDSRPVRFVALTVLIRRHHERHQPA